MSRSRVADLHRQLAELHRELAEELAKDETGAELVDQYHSPLGKRRHLELVRDGVLAGYKPDRVHVFVSLSEIHAYLRKHPSKPTIARASRVATLQTTDDPDRLAKRIRAELGMRKRA